MTREKYESLPLKELREIAKARGMKSTTALRKGQLIDRMLEEDEKDARISSDAGRQMQKVSIQDQAGTGTGQDPADTGAGHDPTGTGTEQDPVGIGAVQEQILQVSDSGNASGTDPADGKASLQSGRTGNNADQAYSEDTAVGDVAAGTSVQKDFSTVISDAPQVSEADSSAEQTVRSGQTRRQYGNNNRRNNNGRNDGRESRTDRNDRERRKSSESTGGRSRGENQNGRERQYRSDSRSTQQTDRMSASSANEASVSEEENRREELRAASALILKAQDSAHGILEVLPDGYGFIRSANFLPGDQDVYVSPSQIRRFNLKTGDYITGSTRSKAAGEKFNALIHIDAVNDLAPDEARRRVNFEDMTPVFPNRRLKLEYQGVDTSMRIVDLVSPIGYGQRGMIVSQPKAGKTTLLKQIARSVLRNAPDMHMIILLIDERPEEVTDMKEAIQGDHVEVIYSTFDELPEHHKRVSEMVIERAKRLVEHKEDVIILLDSITRLARAYNLTVPPSGRTLSGGLDPAALHMPKRFFGAARNMREGGSLTILATALVETGSKMDDVVYEEFKGTGNMELVLDRKLSERRVFPAIDIVKSGTRREDLLLTKEESAAVLTMRRSLNGLKAEEASETLLNLFVRTRNNREFCDVLTKRRMSGN